MDSAKTPARAPRPAPISIVSEASKSEAFTTATMMTTSPARSPSNSISSDYSPVTPCFSTTTTTRFSSSNSSIASSPLIPEQSDLTSSTTFTKRSAPALPDVQEDPFELDEPQSASRAAFAPFRNRNWYATPPQTPAWPIDMSSFGITTSAPRDLNASTLESYSSDTELRCEPSPKRRRSDEAGFDKITNRLFTSLPSLTKHKSRKRHLASHSEGNSGFSTPSGQRSRSNSRARTSLSFFRKSDAMDTDSDDLKDQRSSDRIGTITEDESHEDQSQNSQSFHPSEPSESTSRPDPPARVHTPLLPMLIDDAPPADTGSQCLEQPRIVDSVIGDVGYESPVSIQPTPQLSAKPSAVFAQGTFSAAFSEASELTADLDLSMLVADEWSDKLGHADFHIRPKPYLPSESSGEACITLLSHWDQTRSEFSKHLARTGKTFGHDSKTYRLTEEKWAEIDRLWKRNYDEVRAGAARNGEVPPGSPDEPAPVVKIPSLDNKFPQLSDFEIVGAMERVAPPERAYTQIKRDSSMKSGFKKLMDGLNMRSRSASGPQ